MNRSFDNYKNGNYLNLNNPYSSSSKNIINNYGIKVDDAVLFRKMLQNKYREDLDDLIRLKKNESQNINNQNNEDSSLSRVQRMNERYNLEKMTQQALFKEYNIFNEKEAEEKKQKMKELKENQYKEYLEKLNSINTEKEITKMINQEKKEQLRKQIENDLVEYRKKKFNEKQKEQEEIQNYLIDRKNNNDAFYNIEKKYRSKISKMNNNIYKNALIYNDYLNEGKNNDIFKIKDDLKFNQKIAEIKQKEKQEKIMQDINNIKIQKQKNNIQNMLEKEIKEQKLLEQQNYKNFLDKQKIEQKNNNNNVLIMSGEQLLMPSYRYSNVPKSLINYTLNKSSSVKRNLNIDDSPKRKFYLGDSSLRHNPITCPIEDTSPKKYILSQLYRQQQFSKPKLNTDNQLSFLSSDFGINNNFLKNSKTDLNCS